MGVNTLWWDLGGVVLTNGWDAPAREKAVRQFGLDAPAFEARHRAVVNEFECAKLSLDEYVTRTVFDRPRAFSRDDFTSFMYAQSRPHDEVLELLADIRRLGSHLMVVVNNESYELNRHRIQTFELRRYFDLFISSCFVGLRKPDERIYRLALEVTQRQPEECLLIDDRPVNLESAFRMGVQTIHCQNGRQLRSELARHRILS